MRIKLVNVAHARSGDKGDTANVGLIALREELYPLLVREVTAERVKQHFKGICKGEVDRFELPNLSALNFLLHESLGGGGTCSAASFQTYSGWRCAVAHAAAAPQSWPTTAASRAPKWRTRPVTSSTSLLMR